VRLQQQLDLRGKRHQGRNSSPEAVAIPYNWEKAANIESNNVAGVGDLWNGGAWDYAYSSLR
jgi:hypothetical protein